MLGVVSKRDEIVPSERQGSRKWTRARDYVPGAEQILLPPPRADMPSRRQRISRRGLWLPIYGLGFAAAMLWMGGAFERETARPAASAETPAVQVAQPRTSEGLVFGLCDQGGGTNCVVDGDSFYMAGKAIRIAGIDAPGTHSAHCDAEALLGWAAAERLQSALNSGAVTTSPVQQSRDPNGRLLRTVKIDGRDVARTLIAAGLAKPSGDKPSTWC